jgi:hypothetical protein
MKMTVSLNKEELEAILRQHFRANGHNVESVNFDVNERWAGYGPNEYKVTEFEGVTMEVTQRKQTSYSSLGSQIADVESGNVVDR